MSTFKRINGDYTIQSIESDGVVTLDTDRVLITGNLEVTGNVTYISTTQLDVEDPFLLLNRSDSGGYFSNAGILTHTTSSSFAGLRYNTDSGFWELSDSTDTTGETGTWTPILTGVGGNISAAGANTEIQFNLDGSFGAESAFTYDQSINQLSLDGTIVLSDQGSAPANVSGSTVLYANTAGSGGTGIYVVDDSVDEELVSKSKAIVFGIIF